MTAEEFLKAMKILVLAYDKEMPQEQLNAWYPFFAKDDYTVFKKSVTRIISTNKFFPSIAELKEEIARVANPPLQGNADDAWESVLLAVRKYGYYNPKEAMESLNPMTQRTVRLLGGFQRICVSEDGDWLRKNFKALYEEASGHAQRVAQITNGALTNEELATKAQMLIEDVAKQKRLTSGEEQGS